jgi:hypothetical protein
MKIGWETAEPPLSPVAVAGHGTVGTQLAERAKASPHWESIRFSDWCVVIGDELPWIDGVIYLGLLPGTTDVLIPVHHRPQLHPDLVARAGASIAGDTRGRIALIPVGDGVSVLRLGSRS